MSRSVGLNTQLYRSNLLLDRFDSSPAYTRYGVMVTVIRGLLHPPTSSRGTPSHHQENVDGQSDT